MKVIQYRQKLFMAWTVVSFLFIVFPRFGVFFGGAFILPQVMVIAYLPILILSTRRIACVLFFIASVLFFLYTFFTYDSPTYGILYLLGSILLSSELKNSTPFMVHWKHILVILMTVSIALSFYDGADRVMFLGGDPNYTALFLGLMLIFYLTERKRFSTIIPLYLGVLIFFTLSRSGILFLLLLTVVMASPEIANRLLNRNNGMLLVLTSILSIIVSYLVLQLVFENQMPEYVYRVGMEKLNIQSIVDVSNYIRLESNIFMFKPEFRDVIWFGATENNRVAFDFADKFVRPHNFLSSMIFEFGLIYTAVILSFIVRTKYWSNSYIIIWLCVFGATLGFGPYYGYIFSLLLVLSANSASSQLNLHRFWSKTHKNRNAMVKEPSYSFGK